MRETFSNLTLLYAEDDEVIRENAVRYLGRLFLKVFEAKDGIEALELYRDFAPDIIITDIKMPKLDGLELSKKIREADLKTPIIITTAYSDNALLLQALKLQLTNYLVKPISQDALHKALSTAYSQITKEFQKSIQLTNSCYYDPKNQMLFEDDESIKLTKNQLLLLDLLVKNSNRVVTYSEIENRIWFDSFMSLDTLRSLVRSLRKRVDGLKIDNISGIGYKIATH